MPSMLPTRRAVVAGIAAAATLNSVRAQPADAIRIGCLVPLTGASGVYGQPMAKVAKAVIDEVNAAGGVGGKQIVLIVEDDQSNTDGSVRGARKLIDVDKVAAIVGTFASAGTVAIEPLCFDSKTFLATVSGADAVTQMKSDGFLIRTQPNTTLQGRKFGEYALEAGGKRVYFVTPQTPFAQSQFDSITGAVKKAGGETGILIYDDKKPSYRSEVDEALRFKPDAVIFGGYTPDTTVMLKDFYRAGFAGKKIAFGYSVNQSLISNVPADVVEGIVTISPSPNEGSRALARTTTMLGGTAPDPYSAQVYDHTTLIILSLAAAGTVPMNGEAIKAQVRKVMHGSGGAPVECALDGMAQLAAGKPIAYDGASGPCEFTPAGDILDCKFRYDVVKAGKITLIRIA